MEIFSSCVFSRNRLQKERGRWLKPHHLFWTALSGFMRVFYVYSNRIWWMVNFDVCNYAIIANKASRILIGTVHVWIRFPNGICVISMPQVVHLCVVCQIGYILLRKACHFSYWCRMFCPSFYRVLDNKKVVVSSKAKIILRDRSLIMAWDRVCKLSRRNMLKKWPTYGNTLKINNHSTAIP